MSSDRAGKSEILRRHLQPFFQQHHALDVEWRFIPWNRGWSTIIDAVKNDDLPDVLQVGSTWVGTLAALNVFEPVPKGLLERSLIAPWIGAASEYRGEQLLSPWFVDCNLLVARGDIMDQLQLTPEDLADWDGFVAACRLVEEHGTKSRGNGYTSTLPMALHSRPDLSTLHWASSWLWSGGWEIPASPASGKAFLSDETALPGLKQLARLFPTDETLRELTQSSTDQIYTDFFREGRYAFYAGLSGGAVRELDPRFNQRHPWPLTLLPLPAGPAGAVSRGGASLLGVSRSSTQKEFAWELIRRLTDCALLTDWVTAGGEVPAHAGEYWDEKDSIPFRTLLYDTLQSAATYPLHPLWSTIERFMADGLGELLWHYRQYGRHDETAEKIVRRIDGRIDSLFDLCWGMVA